MSFKVGFIGAGNIVKSICQGFFKSDLLQPGNVCLSASNPTHSEWAAKLGCGTFSDNNSVVKNSRHLILAVKPHIVGLVLNGIDSELTEDHLIISVAAGVKLADLEKLTTKARVARIMLNTTVATTNGASVYTLGKRCHDSDSEVIEGILKCLGYCTRVPESAFDVVSALLGSGPAYLYGIIESMADGAVYCGLGRKEAMDLAAYTLAGTGLMAVQNIEKVHPAKLRDDVCSPGGSSICGVLKLEQSGYRKAFMEAVIAACEKNVELGKKCSK